MVLSKKANKAYLPNTTDQNALALPLGKKRNPAGDCCLCYVVIVLCNFVRACSLWLFFALCCVGSAVSQVQHALCALNSKLQKYTLETTLRVRPCSSSEVQSRFKQLRVHNKLLTTHQTQSLKGLGFITDITPSNAIQRQQRGEDKALRAQHRVKGAVFGAAPRK